jgi:hypothetical protein
VSHPNVPPLAHPTASSTYEDQHAIPDATLSQQTVHVDHRIRKYTQRMLKGTHARDSLHAVSVASSDGTSVATGVLESEAGSDSKIPSGAHRLCCMFRLSFSAE